MHSEAKSVGYQSGACLTPTEMSGCEKKHCTKKDPGCQWKAVFFLSLLVLVSLTVFSYLLYRTSLVPRLYRTGSTVRYKSLIPFSTVSPLYRA